MSPVEVLANIHVVALPVVAIGAIGVWLKQRTRPSAYLAACFSVLATVIVLTRVLPPDRPSFIPVLGLGGFAWLLAAFAWSFEGPLPPSLKASSVVIPVLAGWELAATPLQATDGVSRTVFVVAFLVVWTLFAGAASVRLVQAGGDHRIVRARTRAMALGIVTLNLALVLAALPENDPTWMGASVATLAFLAATLFFVSFLAPPGLRLWWRRDAVHAWERMQQGLIAASTPAEVAAAAAPVAAELTGGSVAIVTRSGEVLAHAGHDRSGAQEWGQRLAGGEELGDQQRVIAVNRSWMIVDLLPHTPVFGQQELAIVENLARHLELALERTELAGAHQEALASARDSQREVELLLAGLAHDLRSPSVAIAGYLSLLRHVDDAEERAQMLDALEESASYIGSLVDSITELATVGRGHVDVEPVALDQLVDQVARRLAVQHPGLSVTTGSELPVVLMNPSSAEQLFDNLIRNAAIHGGRDNVRVCVSAENEPDGATTIAVSDDGIGIDERDREHVLKTFHRGRNSTTGSGLGLSIARRVIESVGGTLRLAEASSTPGTTFLLCVPSECVVSQTTSDQLQGPLTKGTPPH